MGAEPRSHRCPCTTKGISSSAAVGAAGSVAAVFTGGGDGQVYALNAVDGSVLWHMRLGPSPDNYVWSSPVLYDGSVYIGLSSAVDCPLVQGKLLRLDAATGAIQNTFDIVPNGCTGGSLWGTPTIDTSSGMLYFASGNDGSCGSAEPFSTAVVEVRASDLSYVASWKVPPGDELDDTDFGSAPTLFSAVINGSEHQLLGIANKNGRYYAFDRTNLTAGPVWSTVLAAKSDDFTTGGSISPSAYDGTRIYAAGSLTTINGSSCAGSLRALDPATGAILWEDCLPSPVLGPVTALPGVVIVGDGNELLLVDAAAGATVLRYPEAGDNSFWGGAAVADGSLYFGNQDGSLTALALPSPLSHPTPDRHGSVGVGSTLSADNGTWTFSPASFAKQWLRCDANGANCVPIVGATGDSYTPTISDIGSTIRVEVTATNSRGSGTSDSSPTSVVTPAVNLAPDADLEQDPASAYYTNGSASFSWATDQAHSASHSLKIVSSSSTLTRWMSQTSQIQVTPGASYTVSAWLKTSNASSAYLAASYWTTSSSYQGTTVPSTQTLSGSQDWTQLSFQTTAPADAHYVRFEARLNGPGTVWIDDITVTAG